MIRSGEHAHFEAMVERDVRRARREAFAAFGQGMQLVGVALGQLAASLDEAMRDLGAALERALGGQS